MPVTCTSERKLCCNCGMELDTTEIFDIGGEVYCKDCHDFEMEKFYQEIDEQDYD